MNFKVFSMTGFSSLSVILPFKDGLNITMNLRSLNSKYFEFNAKLPFALSNIETSLSKRFKSRLLRGNVNFMLYISNPNLLTACLEPDFNILTQYVDSIKKIEEKYNIPGTLKIKDLIKLPNIFINKEDASDGFVTKINDSLIQYIDSLIDALIEERLKEGLILAQDIFNRIILIKQYAELLEARSLIIIDQKKEMINQTLCTLSNVITSNTNNVFNNTETNSSISEHIALTIYNQLDKISIHEEIVRFKLHLDNLINILEADLIEKGKKIDFTLQELFREINTIAAKCSDGQISNLAIDIKVELEKVREQTQNIV